MAHYIAERVYGRHMISITEGQSHKGNTVENQHYFIFPPLIGNEGNYFGAKKEQDSRNIIWVMGFGPGLKFGISSRSAG